MAICQFFAENHKYIAGKSIAIQKDTRYNVCMKISKMREIFTKRREKWI